MTTIINFISGPGVGKSVMTSDLFVKMKCSEYNCEIVPEYAKSLVWTNQQELLNDQYNISYNQYLLFRSINNNVDYIITDGSLIHGLAYNILNKHNVSDQKRTHNSILKWFHEFDNINIFLTRNKNIKHETIGRNESEDEAIRVDKILEFVLLDNNIEHFKIDADVDNTLKIINLLNLNNSI